jgi:small subunit ribosomal protein S6
LREYELMYLLSPELPEDEMTAATERVSSLITNRGGEITKADTWGRRRLAYPIRRHLDGYYTVLRFNFEPDQTVELERNLRLTEQVLRHIIVHAEDVPPPRTIRRVPVPEGSLRQAPPAEAMMRPAPAADEPEATTRPAPAAEATSAPTPGPEATSAPTPAPEETTSAAPTAEETTETVVSEETKE